MTGYSFSDSARRRLRRFAVGLLLFGTEWGVRKIGENFLEFGCYEEAMKVLRFSARLHPGSARAQEAYQAAQAQAGALP